jgi:dihydrofolate synthase/folylpolyglutamate synthase
MGQVGWADGGDPDEPFLREWRAARQTDATLVGGRHPGAAPRRGSRERARLFAQVLDAGVSGPAMPVIGIVGSKGKGTAVLHAAAALAGLGVSVGSITSPGVLSGRDRVRVNGVALTPGEYRDLADRAASALTALPPPAHPGEYIAPHGVYLLAGAAFLAERCEVLVAEAGIGGASDELSLLPVRYLAATSAFAEHTALLGATVREIAEEKVGAAGPSTRLIVYLDDAGPLAGAARRHSRRLGIRAQAVQPPADAAHGEGMAGGRTRFAAANAAVGVAAAVAAARDLGYAVDLGAVERMVATVRYPGRGSVHPHGDGGCVIVDSPVTGEGLSAALGFARARFGGEPDRIAVSLPRDKDLAGFGRVLGGDPERVVFVTMDATHLDYPDPPAWAARHATQREIPELVTGGNVVAAGTALFTGAVLAALEVSVEVAFGTGGRGKAEPRPPAGSGRPQIPKDGPAGPKRSGSPPSSLPLTEDW